MLSATRPGVLERREPLGRASAWSVTSRRHHHGNAARQNDLCRMRVGPHVELRRRAVAARGESAAHHHQHTGDGQERFARPSSAGAMTCRGKSCAIAASWRRDYPRNMRSRLMRRGVAFVVVTALMLGLAAHGLMAAPMDARMPAVAAVGGMSSPDGCKACVGNDAMSTTACFAFCSNAAVGVLPELVTLGPTTVESTIALPVRSVIGRMKPPDLHPPKTVALS